MTGDHKQSRTGQEQGMYFCMDKYYRGYTIDTSFPSLPQFKTWKWSDLMIWSDDPNSGCLLLFLIHQWGQPITSRTRGPAAKQHSSFVFWQTNQWGSPTRHTRTVEWHSTTTAPNVAFCHTAGSSRPGMLPIQVLEHGGSTPYIRLP